MARFCSELRKRGAHADVSMRDIYLNPTIEGLAALLDRRCGRAPIADETASRSGACRPAFAYYGCGALQALFYVGYGTLVLWLLVAGFEWVYAAVGDWTAF